jgi:3',5'-cyclic AMP phosphodiesterase CpdA
MTSGLASRYCADMNRILPVVALTVAGALLVCPRGHAHPDHDSQEPWQPAAYAEALAHAPSPLPDRVVLTWAGDPATTQAVTWRTDPSVRRALAQLALAVDDGRAMRPTEHPAQTTELASDLGHAHYHSVQLRNLQPDTLYAYRVGDGVNWSEWFHFRTARREPAPFTFVYFGDAQNELKTHWSRVFREAFREAPRAAFTLHAGDLVNRADRDAEWGEWFGAPGWVNGTIPVFATPGNHEYIRVNAGPDSQRLWTIRDGQDLLVEVIIQTEGESVAPSGYQIRAEAGSISAHLRLDEDRRFVSVDDAFTALTGYTLAQLAGTRPNQAPLRDRRAVPGESRLTAHWREQFAFPTHGPAGLEETVYFIDYQGARLISLNSMEKQEEQAAWLRKVLTNNPQRWTIITFHHPIFSPARDRDNPRLRDLWKPVFDEFRVDLVLTGHDHTYARSGDVSAAVGTANVPAGYQQVYDPAIGTVYVVSVSGPKMYGLGDSHWAVRFAEDTQLYQIITVDPRELRFEARTATNQLYDQFTLRKREGLPNLLIEALPPENRRSSAAAP